MGVNIRKGEIPDSSVTAAKLDTGAVDLGTDKVTGQAPSSKLEDGAVIESKLGALAVSTEKLKANSVTLAKVLNDVKIKHFYGDELADEQTGIVEKSAKEFNFGTKQGSVKFDVLRIISTLWSSDVGHTASMKVYIDDVLKDTGTDLQSTSITSAFVSSDIDISALSYGKHKVEIKIVSDDAGETVYTDMLDAYLVPVDAT